LGVEVEHPAESLPPTFHLVLSGEWAAAVEGQAPTL
jgi:hypothetical protein